MISIGLTRGISFIVRQSRYATKHMSTKNMTGSQFVAKFCALVDPNPARSSMRAVIGSGGRAS